MCHLGLKALYLVLDDALLFKELQVEGLQLVLHIADVLLKLLVLPVQELKVLVREPIIIIVKLFEGGLAVVFLDYR